MRFSTIARVGAALTGIAVSWQVQPAFGQAVCSSLCPDGTDLPFPDKEIASGTTCAFYEDTVIPSFTDAPEDCSANQIAVGVAQCDCPAPTNLSGICSFCEDGSEPPIFIDPEADEDTKAMCAMLYSFSSLITNVTECEENQVFSSVFCGCPGGTQGTCTLCHDGSEPTNLEGSGLTFGDEEESFSCSELANMTPLFEKEDEACLGIQMLGSASCGCPPPVEGSCSLCTDGSTPTILADPNADPDTFENCNMMNDFSMFLTNETQCEDAQLAGSLLCGCPPVAGDGSCTLCFDGSTPANMDGVIPAEIAGYEITCESLVSLTTTMDEGTEDCTNIRASGSIFCGCPVPITGSCTMCADGQTPANLTNGFIPAEIADSDFDIQCSFIKGYAPTLDANSSDCKDTQLTSLAFCGCPHAQGSCTLCRDGSEPTNLDAEIPNSDGELDGTCLQFYQFAPYFGSEDEECKAGQAVGDVYCGCPSTTLSNDICTLCEGNTPPTNLNVTVNNTETGDSMTCKHLSAYAQTLAATDNGCVLLKSESQEICGCQDDDSNPTSGSSTTKWSVRFISLLFGGFLIVAGTF